MTFDESKHPRDHGRFSTSDGGGITADSKSRNAATATATAKSSGSSADHAAAATAHKAAASAHKLKFRDTEEEHKVGNEWKPERVKIHEGYTKAKTEGIPKSSSPTVYMTGGGPASGKSSGLLKNPDCAIPGHDKAAHIDPDSAKTHIPEYNKMKAEGDDRAAAYAHEESSHMAKSSVESALASGHDVVYDTVGDSGIGKLTKKVEQMRAQGAKRVIANYATCDVDEAIRRSDARAKDPKSDSFGRVVPVDYIREAHRDVSRTTRDAIKSGLFDKIDVYDTSGRKPKHIASAEKGGQLVIHDQEAWDAFTRRGN